MSADLLGQIDAVDIRQAQVEQHQGRCTARDEGQRLCARTALEDFIALLLEDEAQDFAHGRLVLDD